MTSQYVGTITTMKLFPYSVEKLGFYGTVYVYAAFGLVLPLWAMATVKTTDGASLVEVEQMYDRRKGKRPEDGVRLLRYEQYGATIDCKPYGRREDATFERSR